MKKFPFLLLIIQLLIFTSVGAQEALKISESDQGLMLEFSQSDKIEVTNFSQIENPSRLILSIENCALTEDYLLELHNNSLFNKIKIRTQDRNCQIILSLTGISWAGNNIAKNSSNQLSFGVYLASKNNTVSSLTPTETPNPTVSPLDIPAESVSPEPSPSSTTITESTVSESPLSAATVEISPEPTVAEIAEPSLEPSPVTSATPEASPELSPLPEITPILEPTPEVSPVEEQKVLNKINFNASEQALILEFSARPAYELKKKSDNIYELDIEDFAASNPQLLLPYYAPTTLNGFEKLIVADQDDLEILIFATPNYKINANTIDNSVILTAEALP